MTRDPAMVPDARGAQAFPLGATVCRGGVNFSLFSRSATRVELLFFDRVDDPRPSRTIDLDPRNNRTYHYWHAFVPSAGAGQLYGYRVHGPFDPALGLRFDATKVLLDPYGLAVAVMGVVIWVILQPNLSTSIVMLVIWAGLLWAAGLRIRHLLIFAGTVPVFLLIAIPIMIELDVIKEYQLGRVTSFLFPDPNARWGDDYNVTQALISIGSGGWFGQGYGQGSQVQLRCLKIRHSDFIFSAMAHEFGLLGTLLVLLVLGFVIYRCLRAARLSRDTFGALICYGVAILIAFQAMVNIGVNLRLLPAG